MNCSCTVPIYSDDWDGETGERIRRARKEHKCYECGETININSNYHFFSCFGNKTISNYKICKNCKIILDHFFDNGWIFGQVWDDLNEYLYDWKNDLPSDCISKLPAEIRDKICDILQKFQEK